MAEHKEEEEVLGTIWKLYVQKFLSASLTAITKFMRNSVFNFTKIKRSLIQQQQQQQANALLARFKSFKFSACPSHFYLGVLPLIFISFFACFPSICS